jgi:crooked neck
MSWEPQEQAWMTYANFEGRQGQVDRARGVWERFVAARPEQRSYLRFARWEERANGQKALARRVYERAMEELRDDEKVRPWARPDPGPLRPPPFTSPLLSSPPSLTPFPPQDASLFIAFAKFEERCGEEARARVIFKFGLSQLAAEATAAGAAASAADGYASLQREYTSFEKTHGDRAAVEDVIVGKRRAAYEAAVSANPLNFDAWLDFTRMEESLAHDDSGAAAAAAPSPSSSPSLRNCERIRDVYERAIASVPPIAEKRYWRRYVYLWLHYALYEETVAGDIARARAVYRAALKVVPHRTFSFGKLWVLAAQCDVRAKDLPSARRLLGQSLGLCPKESVLRAYIALELSLGEVDRCRALYEKYLTLFPTTVGAWTKFADLERSLAEDERARAIYELAVSQPALDLPELAWKAYIDFEVEVGEVSRAHGLYHRLLSRTSHVKVWLSFATFELTVAGDPRSARNIYERAYRDLKSGSGAGGGLGVPPSSSSSSSSAAATAGGAAVPSGADAGTVAGREQRALLVEAWRAFEEAQVSAALENGEDSAEAEAALEAVRAKVPTRVKRRRQLYGGGGGGGQPRTVPSYAGEAPVGSEEYWDYIFPDDESKPAHLKLLELAQKWKKAAAAGGGGGGGGAGASATALLAQALAGPGGPSAGGMQGDNGEGEEEEEEYGSGGYSGTAAASWREPLDDGAAAAAAAGDDNEIDLDAVGGAEEGVPVAAAASLSDFLAAAVSEGARGKRAREDGGEDE